MKIDASHILIFLLSLSSMAYAIPNLAETCELPSHFPTWRPINMLTMDALLEVLIQSYFTYESVRTSLSVSTVPPVFEFWKSLKDLAQQAVDYAERSTKEEFAKFSTPPKKIEELKDAVNDLINSTRSLDVLYGEHSNVTEINRRLSEEVEKIMERLKEEFRELPPEDQTERSKKREEIVDKALEMMEDAMVKVYGYWDITEAEVRRRFGHVKPKVRHVVLVIENLVDKHPELLDIVLFNVAVMIAPESPIVRVLLRMIGIGLGSDKGSPTSWVQRLLYGGFIEAKSWRSRLAEAGDPKQLGFWGKVLVVLEQMLLEFIKGFLKAFLGGRRRKI